MSPSRLAGLRRGASLLLVLYLALIDACATIPRADCGRATCGGSSRCTEAGNSALARGEPDAAECFFQRALTEDPGAPGARLGLGAALAVTGRFEKARSHFRWLLRHSPDPTARERALAWLKTLDQPTRVAVYYTQGEGCEDEGLLLARYAARVVRSSIARFGPFAPAGSDVRFVAPAAGALEVTRRAWEEGAQIALVVRLRCSPLQRTRQHSLARGLLFVSPPLVRTTAEVVTEIEAFSVSQQSWFETFVARTTASGLLTDIAMLSAINTCIANTIFRLTSRLALEF